ncbi:uncharacterized protein [Aegilops tauschii subsp. strangulata]|uniref:uncharacterized protein isoform X1 n=1 Tax=Aegilops tauschii subsp. strangulata TaxID=200361 RepID=UPI001ABBF3D1|nr:uncharacterized protein LOC120962668 isoform X1 [Aegilops tauschii subsp. strangulata]XP_040251326.1 uncharacterized protein LOC120968518 isoform X1 [Aegilops tauschii subsp. strangulata]
MYLALFLQELSGDEGGFDKALLKFYMNQKVKCLNRKLSSAGRRNVEPRNVFFVEESIVSVLYMRVVWFFPFSFIIVGLNSALPSSLAVATAMHFFQCLQSKLKYFPCKR